MLIPPCIYPQRESGESLWSSVATQSKNSDKKPHPDEGSFLQANNIATGREMSKKDVAEAAVLCMEKHMFLNTPTEEVLCVNHKVCKNKATLTCFTGCGPICVDCSRIIHGMPVARNDSVVEGVGKRGVKRKKDEEEQEKNNKRQKEGGGEGKKEERRRGKNARKRRKRRKRRTSPNSKKKLKIFFQVEIEDELVVYIY